MTKMYINTEPSDVYIHETLLSIFIIYNQIRFLSAQTTIFCEYQGVFEIYVHLGNNT